MRTVLVEIPLLFNALNGTGRAWKSVRNEFSFDVWNSNFLGDLGGAKVIGTPGFKDLKLQMTKSSLSGGYKCTLNPYFSVKTTVIWNLLSGDDALTKNEIRNNRNLSFRSNSGEIASYIEYYPKADKVYPPYKINGIRGNKGFSLTPYFYTGIGLAFFNPKTKFNEQLLTLQPKANEGQGSAGRPDKYRTYTISFPIGTDVKYQIDKQLAVGFELSRLYTVSDYTNLNGVVEYANGRNKNIQRDGPRYDDAYMLGLFSIHYRFIKAQVFIPKF